MMSIPTQEQSQFIMQAIIERLPNIAFVKDLEGRYLLANQATATWLGTSLEAMIGKDDSALFSKEIAQSIQAADQCVIETNAAITYEEEVGEGAQVRSLLTQKFPWHDKKGRPQGVVGLCHDITERKLATQQGFRSEQKLREIINSLDTFVGVVSKTGILRQVNQKALDAANLQIEDVVGQPFAETYWWSYSEAVQSRLKQAIEQALQGQEVRYDEQIRIVDGQLITIDFCLVPIFDAAGAVDYLVPSGHDISHRIKTLNAFEKSEQINQAILSALPDLIARMSVDGTYLDIRSGNFPLVHLSEAAVGENVRDVLPPEIAQKRLKMAEKALQTGKIQRHEFSTRTDAETYWRETRMVPLAHNEVLMSVRDFTSLHQTKAELRRSLREEQTARKEAEQANRTKDEFLTVLSHELRTPLNPISGWSSLLMRGTLSEEKSAQAAEAIQRNARLLTQLIDDLLDIARMLRGKIALNDKAVCLKRVVRQAVETVKLAAQAKSLTIETQLDETLHVQGDEIRLQQIIWNLLSNAVKFTPENGHINIRLKAVDNQAQLDISDTGIGISPDFSSFVFERFRQENGTTTRQFGGLGLGLSIVRQLTELHGGTVSVDSAGENQGATFTLQLPLLSVQANSSERQEADSYLENCLDACKVLIVEDDADSQEILSVILQAQGASVTQVDSGKACLEQLNQWVPDVLICDIGMPGMDGYELLRLIRQRPAQQGGRVKAVALTAYAGERYEKEAIAAGFQDYLTKPIEINTMVDKLKSVLCPQ